MRHPIVVSKTGKTKFKQPHIYPGQIRYDMATHTIHVYTGQQWLLVRGDK